MADRSAAIEHAVATDHDIDSATIICTGTRSCYNDVVGGSKTPRSGHDLDRTESRHNETFRRRIVIPARPGDFLPHIDQTLRVIVYSSLNSL